MSTAISGVLFSGSALTLGLAPVELGESHNAVLFSEAAQRCGDLPRRFVAHVSRPRLVHRVHRVDDSWTGMRTFTDRRVHEDLEGGCNWFSCCKIRNLRCPQKRWA